MDLQALVDGVLPMLNALNKTPPSITNAKTIIRSTNPSELKLVSSFSSPAEALISDEFLHISKKLLELIDAILNRTPVIKKILENKSVFEFLGVVGDKVATYVKIPLSKLRIILPAINWSKVAAVGVAPFCIGLGLKWLDNACGSITFFKDNPKLYKLIKGIVLGSSAVAFGLIAVFCGGLHIVEVVGALAGLAGGYHRGAVEKLLEYLLANKDATIKVQIPEMQSNHSCGDGIAVKDVGVCQLCYNAPPTLGVVHKDAKTAHMICCEKCVKGSIRNCSCGLPPSSMFQIEASSFCPMNCCIKTGWCNTCEDDAEQSPRVAKVWRCRKESEGKKWVELALKYCVDHRPKDGSVWTHGILSSR